MRVLFFSLNLASRDVSVDISLGLKRKWRYNYLVMLATDQGCRHVLPLVHLVPSINTAVKTRDTRPCSILTSDDDNEICDAIYWSLISPFYRGQSIFNSFEKNSKTLTVYRTTLALTSRMTF